MSRPRVVSQPLAGSALARAALAGTAPPGWYPLPPISQAAWEERLEHSGAGVRRDWLDAVRPALGTGGAALERLERSAAAWGRGGAVVTTGQQPGLFGGPIYTWTKALSALALADALQEASKRPVAPVFWAATDDADHAEASVTYVARPGGLDVLRLPPAPVPGRSLRDSPLGDVSDLLARLAAGAGSVAYPRALEMAARAYGADSTVGGAYVALLRAVLEPLGVAVLDAGHPAVRSAMRPLLGRALAEGERIELALLERDAEIIARGFTPQVAAFSGMSLVMETRHGVRERVPLARARAAASDAAADALGPNVLLRPVAERTLLPSAAYVAGPGELAYFAQVSAVAEALDLPAPLAVPRWSGVIIEPQIERILQRFAISPEELAPAHAAEGRMARERMPEPVAAALAEAARSVAVSLEQIERSAVEDAALVPRAVVEGAERALCHRLGRLERRLVAAVKQREHAVMRDLATARAALVPDGAPQERRLNLLPLLARHGPPLLDSLRDAAGAHARAVVHGSGQSPSERGGQAPPHPAASRG